MRNSARYFLGVIYLSRGCIIAEIYMDKLVQIVHLNDSFARFIKYMMIFLGEKVS